MNGNQDEPKSLLETLREHHKVQVHNPLTNDFSWPVARSVVQLDRQYVDETMQKLNMRHDAHPTMKHVQQMITIPSGKTMNLPGDVAKVVAKHLVDEIMALEGHKSTMGNPELRREIEQRIIINTDNLLRQVSTQSIEEQLNQQIVDMNREETVRVSEESNEKSAFSELNDGHGATANGYDQGDRPNVGGSAADQGRDIVPGGKKVSSSKLQQSTTGKEK